MCAAATCVAEGGGGRMVEVQLRRSAVVRPDVAIPPALIALAGAGWWWSAQMAGRMNVPMTSPSSDAGGMGTPTSVSTSTSMSMSTSLSLTAFVLGWLAMMAAMMLPAVIPVVRLYARAARAGTVAPAPVFVSGYLLVWGLAGIPVWWAWRALTEPIASGSRTAAMAAGTALIVAGLYQLSPLKAGCLRHCRSPLGFFMRLRGNLRSPLVALRAGASHGMLCLGCCWALMGVLVTLGTMHLGWMLGLAALVFVEKVVAHGDVVGRLLAAALVPAGALLLVQPTLITALT